MVRDDGTGLVSLKGGFDGNNDGNLDCSTLGILLGSTDGFTLGTDEGINMGSHDCGVQSITLGYEDEITLGIDE